jgi:acyl-coenzyme A synthetase/AMP-(fatty) acid ligase
MAFALIDRIAQHAQANAVAPALAGPTEAVTYAELTDRIVKIANRFDDLKLPRLAKALINIANPDLRITVMLAALDYGLVPILAQPTSLKGNLEWDLVIASAEPIWADVRADVAIDDSLFSGRLADGKRRQFPARADNDIAYVVETSGTTGRPKLVAVDQLRHSNRIRNVIAGSDQPGVPGWFLPDDRFITSIGGATQMGVGTYEKLLAAGATSISSPLNPAAFLRLINLYNVTHIATTPRFIDEAMEMMDASNTRCPTVRLIRLTGSMFGLQLIRRLEERFSAEVRVGYGTSEVGGIAGGRVTSKTFVRGYCGKVHPALQLMTAGTRENPGRLTLVNDPVNFTKYITGGRTLLNEQPLYELPDLGYVEDGHLYLVGRADEVYNFSGTIRAYSLFEEEIARLANVKDVAVVNGAALGNDLDLVIGIVADRPIDLGLLGDRLAQRLGLTPARKHFRICQLDQIRRTAAGKVDRAQLVRDYHNLIGAKAGVAPLMQAQGR